MQYYNNTLTVEAGWLIENEIISKPNYDALVLRKNLNVVRRGCNNTPALVQYDSMPERFKRAIVDKVGCDPYKVVAVNQVQSHVTENVKAMDFFETYKLSDGRFLPAVVRREYYANAIVLDAIHAMIISKKAKHSALGHKTTRAWDQIAEAVQELDRTKFPHSLPANPRRLEDKYKKYLKDGVEMLIHKNYCNKNSAKLTEEINIAVICEILASPNNLDNAQVMRIYNQIAEGAKWQKITAQTVANYRDEYETMIYAGRRGSNAFSNKKSMQVKRSAPTQPLYYLTMDGWDVELMYQDVKKNSKGYATTTYTSRPTVVVVLDAFNKYPLGYAIGTQETPDLIRMALRNAAKHTVELFGEMYKAHQIQSDRYQVKNLSPYYEVLGEKFTPARAKNAKSKIIEPYFNRLNKTYCQLQMNWSGFGITSDKEKQPNVEYLNKYKKEFPDFNGVCQQIITMMEAERDLNRDAYLSKWNALDEAEKLPMPLDSYLLAFGATTGFKNMMQGNGLTATLNGQKMVYDCFDTSFRNHASERWEIRYDPMDLKKVLAINKDQTLRYILEEKYVQPMALKDRQVGDSGELQRVREFNYSHEKQITDFRRKNIETMAAAMLILPQLQNDTLKKLLITDSNGQHKDRRNDGRSVGKKAVKAQEVSFKTKLRNSSEDVVEEEEIDHRSLY